MATYYAIIIDDEHPNNINKKVILMIKRKEANPQFITDKRGRRISVILPIEEYERILEELDDLSKINEREDEELVTHEEVIEELKSNGKL